MGYALNSIYQNLITVGNTDGYEYFVHVEKESCIVFSVFRFWAEASKLEVTNVNANKASSIHLKTQSHTTTAN